MIEGYKIQREKLYNLIKESEKTKDGFYWYPSFIFENLIQGEETDYDYFYPRSFFKYKLYFSENDLKAYTSKKVKRKFDADTMYRKSLDFYEKNRDIINFDSIKKKIPTKDFTLEELIDCYEYIYSN